MPDNSSDYIDTPCPCAAPGFCPHFNRTLVGRLWELSRMENDLGKKYRALWAKEGEGGAPLVLEPTGGPPKKGCGCGAGGLRKTR